MNNQHLIPIFSGSLNQSEILLCDARKLHEFLQIQSKFADWIKNRISEYGFVENQDFLVSKILETKNSGRGGNRKAVLEYHITLDMAKELAMVERNEQGRAIRRYFIECERKLLEQAQTPIQTAPKPKALPKKRAICNRDDLSFTRRDKDGGLINWTPPLRKDGLGGYISWHDEYYLGEAWFSEIMELAKHNQEQAYWAIKCATVRMTEFLFAELSGTAFNATGLSNGYLAGFFDYMARFTLAGILEYPKGVPFPFCYQVVGKSEDLEAYLKNAEPLPDDELRWQAWNLSEDCRYRCYENKLAELMAYR